MTSKNIRSYFGSIFALMDKNYKEHKDAFNTDNIGENRIDKAFHILINSMTNVATNQTSTTDEYLVTVSIFSKTARDTIDNIDKAIDFANRYRIKACSPEQVRQSQEIVFINLDSLTPEALQGNDNALVIRLAFRCKTISCVTELDDCNC